jgi:diadenylate cyclase
MPLLELSPLDVVKWGVEILVFALAIYAFIRFAQDTQGSAILKGFVVLAIGLIVGLFTMARFFGLDHLSFVADQGLPILLIGLVVIFQPELRQAFVKLGDTRFLQMLDRQNKGPRDLADEIVQACERCARRGLGVLIVVERRIGIAGFTEGGVPIDGLLSAPLLVSIFFKDTPLHDGAVVVRGRRVIAAGCLLPLSENPNLSMALGTRHRAAIGATEENDALAVVVSEETQRISVALRGQLEQAVSSERLRELLAAEDPDADEPAAEGVES